MPRGRFQRLNRCLSHEKIRSRQHTSLCYVLDTDHKDITQRKKDATRILKLYDSYWEWTKKFHDENTTLWSSINIWDVAKDSMKATLGGGFTYWNDPNYGRISVRGQLERRLLDHIALLQPKEKKALKSPKGKKTPEQPKAKNASTEKVEKPLIEQKPESPYEAVIHHFDNEGIEYVDKTSVGGSLYFFDETEAHDLTDKGYQVHFAKNGTKGTDHRPAWYIKLQ